MSTERSLFESHMHEHMRLFETRGALFISVFFSLCGSVEKITLVSTIEVSGYRPAFVKACNFVVELAVYSITEDC